MAVYPLTLFKWAQIIADVVEMVAVFHNLILFIYHIYHTNRKRNNNKSFLEWLSLLPILLYILTGVGSIQVTFDLRPQFISCKYLIGIPTILYIASKTSVCFLLLERLFTVFQESDIYKFQKYFIYVSRVVLISYFFVQSAIFVLAGKGYYMPEYNHCSIGYPMWALSVIAVGDLIFGSSITILFCRRFLLLIISANPKDNAKIVDVMMKENKLYQTMSKLSLLAMIATFTTTTILITAGLFELGSFWGALDGMVNCWCIILMFKVHDKLYASICGKMQPIIISKICLSCLSCNCCCNISSLKLSESAPKPQTNPTETESKNKDENDNPAGSIPKNQALEIEIKYNDNICI